MASKKSVVTQLKEANAEIEKLKEDLKNARELFERRKAERE